MSESTAPASNKKKRIGVQLVWGSIIGVGGLVFVIALMMAVGGGTAGKIRALKSEGQPTSLGDIKIQSDLVAASDNAAIAIAELKSDAENLVLAMEPIINSQTYGEPLSDSDAVLAAKLLEENAEAIKSIRAAIALPDYGSQIDFDRDQTIQVLQDRSGIIRPIARVLCLKSEVLAREGNHDEAARVGIDVIRLGRHYGNEPSLVSLLVSVALRSMGANSVNDALQAGEVSSDTRESLRAELVEDEFVNAFLDAIRTERVVAIENVKSQGSFIMSSMLGQLLDAAQQQIDEIERDGLTSTPAAVPTPNSPVNPVFVVSRTAAVRWLALSRCLKAVDRLTKTPNSTLADIDLPAEVKIDPFSPAEKLATEKEDGGWSVFSAGPDGVYKAGGGDDVGLRKRKLVPKDE